jgi:hypothetical protein
MTSEAPPGTPEAPAVQLAQHTADTDTPPITQWDACLLIDG